MPTAPLYNGPQIVPGQLPGGQLSTHVPDMSGIGQGLMSLGDAALKIYQEEKDRAESLQLSEYKANARRMATDMLYGKYDENTGEFDGSGVLTRKGQDLFAYAGQSMQDLDKRLSDMEGSLTSPRVKSVFGQFRNDLLADYDGKLKVHLANERIEMVDRTMEVSIASTTDKIVRGVAHSRQQAIPMVGRDEQGRGQYTFEDLDRDRDEIYRDVQEKYLAKHGNAGSTREALDAIDFEYKKHVGKLHFENIQNINAAKDFERAKAYFDHYQDELPLERISDLKNAIDAGVKHNQAQGVFTQLTTTPQPAPSRPADDRPIEFKDADPNIAPVGGDDDGIPLPPGVTPENPSGWATSERARANDALFKKVQRGEIDAETFSRTKTMLDSYYHEKEIEKNRREKETVARFQMDMRGGKVKTLADLESKPAYQSLSFEAKNLIAQQVDEAVSRKESVKQTPFVETYERMLHNPDPSIQEYLRTVPLHNLPGITNATYNELLKIQTLAIKKYDGDEAASREVSEREQVADKVRQMAKDLKWDQPKKDEYQAALESEVKKWKTQNKTHLIPDTEFKKISDTLLQKVQISRSWMPDKEQFVFEMLPGSIAGGDIYVKANDVPAYIRRQIEADAARQGVTKVNDDFVAKRYKEMLVARLRQGLPAPAGNTVGPTGAVTPAGSSAPSATQPTPSVNNVSGWWDVPAPRTPRIMSALGMNNAFPGVLAQEISNYMSTPPGGPKGASAAQIDVGRAEWTATRDKALASKQWDVVDEMIRIEIRDLRNATPAFGKGAAGDTKRKAWEEKRSKQLESLYQQWRSVQTMKHASKGPTQIVPGGELPK
jgi:hypothetical protein